MTEEERERRVIARSHKSLLDHVSRLGKHDWHDMNAPVIIERKTGKKYIDWVGTGRDEYRRRQIMASHGKPTPKTKPRYFEEDASVTGGEYDVGITEPPISNARQEIQSFGSGSSHEDLMKKVMEFLRSQHAK